MADISKVPVFNPEWEEFTEEQKKGIRLWWHGGTWDLGKKKLDFFSHII